MLVFGIKGTTIESFLDIFAMKSMHSKPSVLYLARKCSTVLASPAV
jgi:hypothetical protein